MEPTTFITGVFHLPINITHEEWMALDGSKIPQNRWLQTNKIYLSEVIDDIRYANPNGFLLFVMACRSIDYDPPKGTKIRVATLRK